MLPRWALGNWWSRYYAYTSETYLELMERFQADDVPFSVAVLDMDWHPVDGVDPRYGSGWTGYSWNRDLFPDPPAFLAELHRRGLHVTLNVHPADGVRAFEDAYPEMAVALERSTEAEAPISFDIHRSGLPAGLLRDPAPTAGGRRRRLLVDRLAVRSPLADRRRRPVVDAQPLPLPRLGPRRQAAR